jgi:hypothetical protein
MTAASHFKVQASKGAADWRFKDVVDTEEQAREVVKRVKAYEPASQMRIIKVTIIQEIIAI